jgi:hypothetical protein
VYCFPSVPRRDHLKGRCVDAAQADVDIFRPALVVGLAAKFTSVLTEVALPATTLPKLMAGMEVIQQAAAIAFTDRTSSNNNGALNDTVVLPYSV